MNEDVKHEVEEIDLKIAQLKKRRRELMASLGEGRLSWGAIIAGAFGALLVGLGVIALFAANWDAFGREARAAIAGAPVVACGIAALAASLKGVRARALWEPLGILWCVAVAAAACLVAQTYQVGGSVPSLVLLVAVLMLPVVWVTRAVAPTATWPIMAVVWTISMKEHGSGESIALMAKGVALMALSLPAYIAFLRSRPPRPALIPAQIATGLVYSAGLGTIVLTAGSFSYSAAIWVLWICAALVAAAGRIFRLPVWGLMGAVVSCCVATPTPIGCLANFLAALAIAGATTAYGVAKLRIGLTNIGAATLLWLVMAKFFFDSSVSFTVKGIVLIASGAALTALNIALARVRKARRA